MKISEVLDSIDIALVAVIPLESFVFFQLHVGADLLRYLNDVLVENPLKLVLRGAKIEYPHELVDIELRYFIVIACIEDIKGDLVDQASLLQNLSYLLDVGH